MRRTTLLLDGATLELVPAATLAVHPSEEEQGLLRLTNLPTLEDGNGLVAPKARTLALHQPFELLIRECQDVS